MLFVATELLRGLAAGRNITQTSEHDIESFCWVFMYVLWLRAVEDAPAGKQRYALQAEFRDVFGATNAKELVDNRALAWTRPRIARRLAICLNTSTGSTVASPIPPTRVGECSGISSRYHRWTPTRKTHSTNQRNPESMPD